MKAIKEFIERHPIIFNLLLIAFVFYILCYSALLAVDIFTDHGKEKRVPDVRQLTIDQATAKISEAGFKWKITDSIFNEQYSPGAVIEQEPKGNSYVKSHRTVYLTINSLHPKMVAFPALNEISIRQGMSILQSLGFKNVRVDTVPSEYESLILGVKVNNHGVRPGESIAINSQVKLTIGDGSLYYNPTDMYFEDSTAVNTPSISTDEDNQ